jgi:anti-sigma regulatory factor (Ser/Thr protein kinase)
MGVVMTQTAEIARPVTEVLPAHHGHDRSRASKTSVKTYPAVARSVGLARIHVRTRLSEWRFGELLIEDVCLVTSELVTNAVLASEALAPRITPVHVALDMHGFRLLLAVADASRENPRQVVPDASTPGSRGLRIVARASGNWGWYPITNWPGAVKVVWAEWDTEGR